MTFTVKFFVGLWLYYNRRYYRLKHRRAQRKLKHALAYLTNQYSQNYAFRSRRFMFEEQKLALRILDNAEGKVWEELAPFLEDEGPKKMLKITQKWHNSQLVNQ